MYVDVRISNDRGVFAATIEPSDSVKWQCVGLSRGAIAWRQCQSVVAPQDKVHPVSVGFGSVIGGPSRCAVCVARVNKGTP